MKLIRGYLAGIGIFLAIAVITLVMRFYMTESIVKVPARTTVAELEQLANFTQIRVDGDFSRRRLHVLHSHCLPGDAARAHRAFLT